MGTLAERINQALRQAGDVTQADIARACGISTASVNNWFTGATKSLKGENLLRAAAVLKVSPVWLSTGKGPMNTDSLYVEGPVTVVNHRVAERRQQTMRRLQLAESGVVYGRHPDDPLDEGAVAIRESRVHFAAGNGHVASYELVPESEPATYRLSWLQREGLRPENLRRFKVKGDSMIPFLFENDSVLVNLAENELTRILDGKVYALRYGDDLRIKRLYRRLDGTLILRSDNPAYEDEPVPPHLAEEHITLIGRVRDKSGAGGL